MPDRLFRKIASLLAGDPVTRSPPIVRQTFVIAIDPAKDAAMKRAVAASREKLRCYWHRQGGLWLVEVEGSAQDVYERLIAVLDDIPFLIVGLSGQGLWRETQQNSEWLFETVKPPRRIG